MKDHEREFIELAIERGALTFGDFTLKSGRKSPYFFNAGKLSGGRATALMGKFYASAIDASGMEFDLIFGPAYKGIPLVTTTCVQLYEKYGRDVPYAFNRKEKKDHGEGGNIVGEPIKGRVLIVDDVITRGTAIRESIDTIKTHGAEVAGIVVSLDRQERGQTLLSSIQELTKEFKVPVIRICTLDVLLEYLKQCGGENQSRFEAIEQYRSEFGCIAEEEL